MNKEVRKKLSESHKGQKNNGSEARKGIPLSEGHRENISKGLLQFYKNHKIVHKTPIGKEILRINPKTNEIKKFRNTKDAAASVGKTNLSTIQKCLRGERISTFGYYWKYKDNSQIEKKNIQHRKVLQYNLDGNFIKEYSSIIEAAKAVGLVNESSICACCKGRAKTSAGFKWKYKEEE